MLKLAVIGTGYLGATHAACMAKMGFEVIGVDSDANKIAALSKGELPFYEPTLPELLSEQVKSGRLKFTSNPQIGGESAPRPHKQVKDPGMGFQASSVSPMRTREFATNLPRAVWSIAFRSQAQPLMRAPSGPSN